MRTKLAVCDRQPQVRDVQDSEIIFRSKRARSAGRWRNRRGCRSPVGAQSPPARAPDIAGCDPVEARAGGDAPTRFF